MASLPAVSGDRTLERETVDQLAGTIPSRLFMSAQGPMAVIQEAGTRR
jgi:hypothetical protein